MLLGDVQPEGGGEFVHAGLGSPQSEQGRNGQNRRHADGDGGKQSDAQKIAEEFLPSAPTADFIDKEQEKYKKAGEQADIVVGKHGEEQAHRVKNHLFIPQQLHFAQHHQRKQGEGVQPHDVPLIAQRPGTQAVQAAKQSDGEIILVEGFFQKQGKEQSRKSQLDGHQQGKIAEEPFFRQQHAHKVQGRRQIIGNQPQIVHAQPYAPGVQQAAPTSQRVAEGHKEGVILVVHIGIQHGILAKGRVVADEHDKQHAHTGDGKAQRRVIPLRACLKSHEVPPEMSVFAF